MDPREKAVGASLDSDFGGCPEHRCESSGVSPALKDSSGRGRSSCAAIWVVTRSMQLRPMFMGRGFLNSY
ncbi:hypothetical protein [Ruminococcus sp. Marseille-P6503]|uniref:hypothetical protein n=1 Tax=Ruminococcus sp. Marseille-P6503 TaxID=2364796 RepID=UPI000F51D278|nr:hypothetical protein [Ruminococcus sp. Marseille-P6503]